jgi:hypothetical protein
MCIQIAALKICYSQDIPDIVRLTGDYINNEDFNSLASLYLLPSYFTNSKTKEERKGIKDALSLLSNEFGFITNLKLINEKVHWLNIEIFGGDVDFIKSNLNFAQFVFRTNFSKLGNGFIIIRVYEKVGNPKLRSVGYALPDLPKNHDAIKRISSKLMDLMSKKPNNL